MIFLEGQASTPEMVSAFGGYNHNISINANEFYDMKNASCDLYPLAANRGKRGYHNFNKTKTVPDTDTANIRVIEWNNPNIYDGLAWIKFGVSISKTPYNAFVDWASANDFTDFSRLNQSSYWEDIEDFQALKKWEDSNAGLLLSLPQEATFYNYIGFSIGTITEVERDDDYYNMKTSNMSDFDEIKSQLSECSLYVGNSVQTQWWWEEGYIRVRRNYWTPDVGLNVRLAIGSTGNGGTTVPAISRPSATVRLSDPIISEHLVGSYIQLPYIRTPDTGAEILSAQETETGDYTITLGDYRGTISVDDLGKVSGTETFDFAREIVGFCGKDNAYLVTKELRTVQGSLDSHSFIYVSKFDLATNTETNRTKVGEVVEGRRQIIEMGAYIVILPEKQIVNTVKLVNGQYEVTPMETEVDTSGTIYIQICDANNDNITVSSAGKAEPTTKTNGKIWIDTTNGDAPIMKRYSDELGLWTEVTPYCQLVGGAFADTELEEGDAIRINWGTSDLTKVCPAKNQKYYVIHSIKKNGNYSYITFQCGFKAAVDLFTQTLSSDAEIKRNMPIMDYVIESGNRLWGCRYGENIDGETVNEIYASKLGDPCNWNYFANTSIDSYYVSLGSDGPFTGAVNYQNTPVFFKADCIHRITGYYPANYQVRNITGYGVKPGCHGSAKELNNLVYYLSPVGMMVYSGDTPASLAKPFGTELYHDGIAGTVGNKYYICMYDSENNPAVFVYDDNKAMWHKEDNAEIKCFGTYDNECYAITTDNDIFATGGITGTPEGDVEWALQTGDIGYTNPNQKRLLKLVLRLNMELSAQADLYIRYDNDGIWRHCHTIRPTGRTGSVNLPIMPQRCDHFAIKLEGRGEFKMLSAVRYYTVGSDVT